MFFKLRALNEGRKGPYVVATSVENLANLLHERAELGDVRRTREVRNGPLHVLIHSHTTLLDLETLPLNLRLSKRKNFMFKVIPLSWSADSTEHTSIKCDRNE